MTGNVLVPRILQTKVRPAACNIFALSKSYNYDFIIIPMRQKSHFPILACTHKRVLHRINTVPGWPGRPLSPLRPAGPSKPGSPSRPGSPGRPIGPRTDECISEMS